MDKSYNYLLKRGEWYKRRLYILQRDNFLCQSSTCLDRSGNLEVHHLEYFRPINPWDYPDDLLITLCSVCHKKENIRFIYEQQLLTALKMKGFLFSDIVALTTNLYSNNHFSKELLSQLKEIQNG